MAAAEFHFTNLVGRNAMEQGATFDYPMTMTDDYGNPVNLTGWTFRMQLRSSVSSGTIVLSLTTANSRIVIDDETLGKFRLLVSATDTESVAAGYYVYDLEAVKPGGEVIRLIEGKMQVTAQVTR